MKLPALLLVLALGGVLSQDVNFNFGFAKGLFGCPPTPPNPHVTEKIFARGPYIGIIAANDFEVEVLMGVFEPDTELVEGGMLHHGGRVFGVGTIDGIRVIVVKSGTGPINSALTTQILLDLFPIRIITSYGYAGAAFDSLNFGDVVVPITIAQHDNFFWERTGGVDDLPLGDVGYSKSSPGLNFLLGGTRGRLWPQNSQILVNNEPIPVSFFPTDTDLYDLAQAATNLTVLDNCDDMVLKTGCLTTAPKIVYNVQSVGGFTYVDNIAYRQFLDLEWRAASVDTESASISHVAYSNQVPFMTFRGIIHKCGVTDVSSADKWANVGVRNAFYVLRRFLPAANTFPKNNPTLYYDYKK